MSVSLEEGLRAFLAADDDLIAMIPDTAETFRFYPEMAPQNTPYPYATYSVVNETDDQTLEGAIDMPVARVQIDCYGEGLPGYPDAKRLAKAIRNSRGGNSAGLRLKEFRGDLGGVTVRESWLDGPHDLGSSPLDGSEMPVRRVMMEFTIIYEEQ